MKEKEEVLCIRRWALERNLDAYLGGSQYIPFDFKTMKGPGWYVGGSDLRFLTRGQCEHDPRWLQIIPYIVAVHQYEPNRWKVLSYYRSKEGGENRLHGKMSVGIGGHINPMDIPTVARERILSGRTQDWDAVWPLIDCAHREIAEEINPDCDYSLRGGGWVIEDETDVGLVHVGAVILAVLDDPTKIVPNEELLDPAMMEWEDALEAENPEVWTRIVLSSTLYDHGRFTNTANLGGFVTDLSKTCKSAYVNN